MYQVSAYIDNFDFWAKFAQKGYFWSETGCECEWKVNVTIELCILEVVKIIQKGYICSKTENLYTTIEF